MDIYYASWPLGSSVRMLKKHHLSSNCMRYLFNVTENSTLKCTVAYLPYAFWGDSIEVTCTCTCETVKQLPQKARPSRRALALQRQPADVVDALPRPAHRHIRATVCATQDSCKCLASAVVVKRLVSIFNVLMLLGCYCAVARFVVWAPLS